jgi:hypothetical protein
VQVVRELDVPANWEKEHRDDDHVAWLTQETVQVDGVAPLSLAALSAAAHLCSITPAGPMRPIESIVCVKMSAF